MFYKGSGEVEAGDQLHKAKCISKDQITKILEACNNQRSRRYFEGAQHSLSFIFALNDRLKPARELIVIGCVCLLARTLTNDNE